MGDDDGDDGGRGGRRDASFSARAVDALALCGSVGARARDVARRLDTCDASAAAAAATRGAKDDDDDGGDGCGGYDARVARVVHAFHRAFVRRDVGFGANAARARGGVSGRAGAGGGAAEDADAIDVAAWDACASFEAFESRALAPESRLVAVKAVRARALGVACEAAWEFELTDSAHQALACIAAARERGATTQDVNIATSSKGGDHLIKTLIAADLVFLRKSTGDDGAGAASSNLVFLKRYRGSAIKAGMGKDSKADYLDALVRVLTECENGVASTREVRETLRASFESSDLMRGRSEKAKTKVFNAAKNELIAAGCIEPVLSHEGLEALRFIKPYVAQSAHDAQYAEDGADAIDPSRWTGGGQRGAFIVEQTFETQFAERVRQHGSVGLADVVRDYDVGPRTLEKRLMKMCDEDKLIRKVVVQHGKQRMTRYASVGDDRDENKDEDRDAIISDAERRYAILLKALREEGFLYVNRLSSWLAVAEGGLYKRVDKKIIHSLVDELVANNEAFVHSLSWGITERLPDMILFHSDFPFNPATDGAFIESLKADIRSQEVAVRQPLSKKLGLSETVNITPIPKALPAPSSSAHDDGDAPNADRALDVSNRGGYRTLHNFHAIGLGYVKAGVVRLEIFHLYLVKSVFEDRKTRDGGIDPEILDGAMPISMYIKVINSVESKRIDVEDLEHIKREALLGKLVQDLSRELRDRLCSSHLMSRLTKRLTEMGLLYEHPTYDTETRQIIMTLRMNKIARFQRAPGEGVDEDDADVWSEAFDLTTVQSAHAYWNALEKAFKGHPAMDAAVPASTMSYPRLTSTRSWVRKWALGLDNCIILMNRLQEAWNTLIELLLKSANAWVEGVEITSELVAIAIAELSTAGLPAEDALRVEQLAQDLGAPDDLSHIKSTWRDYCYAQICAANDAGVISSVVASNALKMYSRYSKIRLSRRAPHRALLAQRENVLGDSTRANRLANIGDARARKGSSTAVSLPDDASDESDGDFDQFPSHRKRFVFKQAEDEFLVFSMIRFIALSGPNTFRAEKRDYRAAVVYADPMWRSRYPHVKKRAVVKRWRQLTVDDGEDNEDEDGVNNASRHDAIVRFGSEFYERGAKARREHALPHTPVPAPATEEEAAYWDDVWDCTGKWSEGVAKQVLHATREILKAHPVTYPVLKRDLPKPPRASRVRPKREEKVRRLRAGRDLTEADDDIILARLAPVAFLRRRAITFQDESDDSADDDSSSDYATESEDEAHGRAFVKIEDVPSYYTGAIDAQLRLLDVVDGGAKSVKCVTPSGPQVLALARALVDGRISMSTCGESTASALPFAFRDGFNSNDASHILAANNAAAKMLHSVRIDVREDNVASSDDHVARVAAVGCLLDDDMASSILRDACARVVAARQSAKADEAASHAGLTFSDILNKLRASSDAEVTLASRGASGALAAHRAIDDLMHSGAIRARGDSRAADALYYYAADEDTAADDDADVDDVSCARATLTVIIRHPGISESRIIIALSRFFPSARVGSALRSLARSGAVFARASERFASIMPRAFGGSTARDAANTIELFYFPASSGAAVARDILIT